MVAPKHTLAKSERLKGVKAVDRIFKGPHRSVTAYPIRAVYVVGSVEPGCVPIRIMVSAPKRLFKHAVDRNRVKRQLREAYRLNKQLLFEALSPQEGKSLSVVFIWLTAEHAESQFATQQMVKIMHNISERL